MISSIIDNQPPFRAGGLKDCNWNNLRSICFGYRSTRIVVPKKIRARLIELGHEGHELISEPTARSAVPGVSPGQGLLIPL